MNMKAYVCKDTFLFTLIENGRKGAPPKVARLISSDVKDYLQTDILTVNI